MAETSAYGISQLYASPKARTKRPAPYTTKRSYLTSFPTKRLIGCLYKYAPKGLTCTTTNGTIVPVEGSEVDATTRRLTGRLKELGEQRSAINREERAILTALAVAGVRPENEILGKEWAGDREQKYQSNNTFADRSLRVSCEIILKDHKGQWLSKSEIEYLIVRGGYKFSTDKTKNSVGITLRRMAEEGLCEVQRVRGQQGNRYRWPSEAATKKK
jgi:hypothetical protein